MAGTTNSSYAFDAFSAGVLAGVVATFAVPVLKRMRHQAIWTAAGPVLALLIVVGPLLPHENWAEASLRLAAFAVLVIGAAALGLPGATRGARRAAAIVRSGVALAGRAPRRVPVEVVLEAAASVCVIGLLPVVLSMEPPASAQAPPVIEQAADAVAGLGGTFALQTSTDTRRGDLLVVAIAMPGTAYPFNVPAGWRPLRADASGDRHTDVRVVTYVARATEPGAVKHQWSIDPEVRFAAALFVMSKPGTPDEPEVVNALGHTSSAPSTTWTAPVPDSEHRISLRLLIYAGRLTGDHVNKGVTSRRHTAWCMTPTPPK